MKLAIVTATTNIHRSLPCMETWRTTCLAAPDIVVIVNGPTQPGDHVLFAGLNRYHVHTMGGYLGSVPAFRSGVDWALEHTDADVIACFHDDVEIHQQGWDRIVLSHFQRHPQCGLAGFGGALGLGDVDLYKVPYRPEQLARVHFRSNLVDAEVHGIRSLVPERVACLDGFSQIGRRAFWEGDYHQARELSELARMEHLANDQTSPLRPWTFLENLGIVHHLYDGLLGALAARYGWETWYLPVRCRHLGGQTAVGDAGYQEWAKTQTNGVGDQQFWQDAHRIGYDAFRDVLPLRV